MTDHRDPSIDEILEYLKVPHFKQKIERMIADLQLHRKELDARQAELKRHRSELASAHSELEQSRRKYFELYDLAPVGYLTFDAQGRLLEINRAGADMLGIDPAQIIGRPITDLIAEMHRSRFQLHLAAAVQSGTMQTCELALIRNDGSQARVQVNTKTAASPSGGRRLLAAFFDITVRRQAQEALRESEEHYRALFYNSHAVLLVIDPQTARIINASSAACAFYGYSADQITRLKMTDINTLPARQVQSAMAATLDRQGNYFIFRHRLADGRIRDVEVFSGPISIKGRRLLYSIVHDITERRQAEAALRESEQRLRLFIDHAPASLAMFDRGMHYLSVSRRWLKDYGLEERELIGQSHYTVFPEIPEAWKQVHRRALAGEIVRNEAERFVRADGSVQWLRWEVRPWRDAVGAVAGVVIFSEDITGPKQAEETLKQLNETLEARVAERTRLAEARTRQLQLLAMQLIEAEEQERRRIAQLLHDDLQQLLAGARMLLPEAGDDPAGRDEWAEVRRMLAEASRTTRRLSHELSPAVLHLAGLAGGLKWLARQMDEQFGFTVELQIASEPRVDRAPIALFLFRAVQELLFNTVKHGGVKQARVQLSESEGCLLVTVSDQGRGFDPEILDTFSTTAGLGLLSIRERASYVGGSFSIESAPGQGSRFVLQVPLGQDGGQGPEACRSEASLDQRPQADGLRVLFADDHKVMRQGLITLISRQPDIRIVAEAADGREALELARRLRPDVVIMDIAMPGMDGIEATRAIKAELPGIRVIGLSMHEDARAAQAMREAGADAFVPKTASPAELLRAIYGRPA